MHDAGYVTYQSIDDCHPPLSFFVHLLPAVFPFPSINSPRICLSFHSAVSGCHLGAISMNANILIPPI